MDIALQSSLAAEELDKVDGICAKLQQLNVDRVFEDLGISCAEESSLTTVKSIFKALQFGYEGAAQDSVR